RACTWMATRSLASPFRLLARSKNSIVYPRRIAVSEPGRAAYPAAITWKKSGVPAGYGPRLPPFGGRPHGVGEGEGRNSTHGTGWCRSEPELCRRDPDRGGRRPSPVAPRSGHPPETASPTVHLEATAGLVRTAAGGLRAGAAVRD